MRSCNTVSMFTRTLIHLCVVGYRPHRYLHSFPTRRSSDLRLPRLHPGITITPSSETSHTPWRRHRPSALRVRCRSDRKSTRLNSSHANISYSVFCLKKKKNIFKTSYDTSEISND